MSTRKLSNISIKLFREYLTAIGCKHIRTEGGHEIWTRSDLTRPVVIQTHIDPIPERIIRNNFRTLGVTRKDFTKTMFDC